MGPFVDIMLAEWRRLSVTFGMDSNSAIALETRNIPPNSGVITQATSMVAFAGQVEAGAAYPSSYIPTTNKKVTRATEKLSATPGSELLPGGYLDVIMRFAPNFASTEQGLGEYNILFINPQNRVYLRRTAAETTVVLRIDDVQLPSMPITFEREQELTITAKDLPSGIELTVAGATQGNGKVPGGAGFTLPTNKPIYILSKDSGAEECSDLRYISFQ
jgi:hypothetical protein